MTRLITYLGPSDSFDASLLLGKEGMVFHTYGYTAVPADERGTIREVTNEQADELLSYPNHRFVEVDAERAKPFIARQQAERAIREERARLYAQHGTVAAPVTDRPVVHPALADDQVTAESVQVAPMAPRDASEITREVKAETKALKDAQKADAA